MPLPGSEVQIIDEMPAGGVATATGTGFIVTLAERGPVDAPQDVRSPRQLTQLFGNQVNYSNLHRNVDAFFTRGGERLYVLRVVGPAAVTATGSLPDGAAGSALKVDAANPGQWGNDLSVVFTYNAGTVTAVVKLDGQTVEQSGDQSGKEGITAWSATSRYVRITDGGGGNPTSATVSLSTGDDKRGAITDAEWTAALNLFDPELGPGQVAVPGVATATVHAALLAHAKATNRFALLEGSDNTSGTLLTEAGAATATGDGRYGTLVAPTVDGAPASPFVMGRLAYTDRTSGPGQYAAGANYGELGNVSADADFPDDDRKALNEAGVQVIRNMFGQARIYGFRSLARSDSPYTEAAHSRVLMAVRAEAERVIEQYVLKKIDGRGLLFAQLEGALKVICERFYRAGDLYGENAADAYTVDTGPAVNTPETIAANELHAAIAIRVAPGAERVILTITKAALADTL